MIKIPTWKRILGGLIAFLTPAVIYILFTNGPTLDYIPLMYLWSAASAAIVLSVCVLANEDVVL